MTGCFDDDLVAAAYTIFFLSIVGSPLLPVLRGVLSCGLKQKCRDNRKKKEEEQVVRERWLRKKEQDARE